MSAVEPQELPVEISGSEVILKKLELDLAAVMFHCVDQDRKRLEYFLPWVPNIQKVEDEEAFIKLTFEKWEKREGFTYAIFEKASNEYAGNISVFNLRWEHAECEMGYWISSRFEGKGLMRDAVQTLEQMLFETGFHRLVIRCSPKNERSSNLARRLGYHLDGTMRHDLLVDGEFRDTLIFSKLS